MAGATTKPSKIKPILMTAIKLLLAAALIVWILRQGALDLDKVKLTLSRWDFALALGVLSFLTLVFNTWRWLILLRSQGFNASFGQTLSLSFIGLFFNFAMPGGVGGDVVKGYYLTRDFPHQKMAAVVSVLMDRLIGFFVMLLAASMASLVFWDRLDHDPRLLGIALSTLGATSAFLLVLVFSLSRRLQIPLKRGVDRLKNFPGYEAFAKVYRALHAYRKHPKVVLQALALALVNQVLLVTFFALIAVAVGEGEFDHAVLWFCIPIGLVVQALPLAPAGVGVGQAAFFFLFVAALQRPTQVGTVGITVMQALQFALGLIGAVIYLRRGRRMPSAAELAASESGPDSSPEAPTETDAKATGDA